MNPINVSKKTNEAIESVPQDDIFDFYLNIINKNINESLTSVDNGHLRSAIRNTFSFTKEQASYKLLSQNDVRVAFSKKISYSDVVKNANPTSVKDLPTTKYQKKEYEYSKGGEKVKHSIYSILTFDVVEMNGKIFTKSVKSYVDFMTDAIGEQSPVSEFDFDLNKNIDSRIEYSKTTIIPIIDAFVDEYEGALVEKRLVTEKKTLKSKFVGLDGGWTSIKEGIGEDLKKFNNNIKDKNPSGCYDPRKITQYYKNKK
jgi:hypothetical protein